MSSTQNETSQANSAAILKLIIFSLIGIVFFFVPFSIGGKSTILLDHMVGFGRDVFPHQVEIYALLMILAGGIYPFISGGWQANTTQKVLSILKLLGVVTALMSFFSIGPSLLFEKDMLPFLFSKLVVPISLIVPLGAIFLAFLLGYGLLEFFGVLLQPIMKPLFKTPGKSAIDAVASFVGSYSIGLLITNRVYNSGHYSAKEAAIIATGFSTVSATFMVIVAKTLNLMDIWNLFFWSTLLLTFLVTAITVRLPPLANLDDNKLMIDEKQTEASRITQAVSEGLEVAKSAEPLLASMCRNFKEGMLMVMGILPSIMSVGLIGLLLAKFTPVFELLGMLFYPFAWLIQTPDPELVSKAAATGLAEMFLPSLLVTNSDFVTRFVVAQISISSILFFSASIPCILSTQIPITVKHILIIWYQRTLLTLLMSTPLAYLNHYFISK
ncbi:YjiH family protein [Pseudoalteromonas elyakovii]|nr:YjiH family protein [Pseudoalteromonas elyakovii]